MRDTLSKWYNEWLLTCCYGILDEVMKILWFYLAIVVISFVNKKCYFIISYVLCLVVCIFFAMPITKKIVFAKYEKYIIWFSNAISESRHASCSSCLIPSSNGFYVNYYFFCGFVVIFMGIIFLFSIQFFVALPTTSL